MYLKRDSQTNIKKKKEITAANVNFYNTQFSGQILSLTAIVSHNQLNMEEN